MPSVDIPLILLFYELLLGYFAYGTSLTAMLPNVIFTCLCFGIPLGLLALALRGTSRKIYSIVIRLLLAIPFLVEFFIYMQFKTLYDINTMLFGGAGALGGFASTIKDLVFSPTGILYLFLFLLPTILYVVRIIIRKNFKKYEPWKIGLMALLIPIAFFANQITIKVTPELSSLRDTQYNFQGAYKEFGLNETLLLDLRAMMSSPEDSEFQSVEVPLTALPTSTPTPIPTPVPTVPGATPTPTPTPTPEPQPQVMDIDFDSLREMGGTIASLADYCEGLEPTYTNEYTGLFAGKNLIMITAEAFTAEVIDPVRTPYLYRLATRGINFTDSYVPATAGTIGGEFSHISGMLPYDGGVSLMHLVNRGSTYFTMGQRLNALGYYGAAFHNNDYQFYDRHITHNGLGYSEGYTGWGNGLESYIDPNWPESDLQMMECTLPTYINQQPFNIYYMSVSGHSNYSRYANAQSRRHWDETIDLDGQVSDTIRAYQACQIDLDRAIGYILEELEAHGLLDDTVIAICADHYPYGLEQPYLEELYGHSITTTMQRDHNRLIIWSGCLEDEDPIIVDTPTSSLDMLPTLLNLFGIEYDSRLLPGRDVFSDAMPLVFNLGYEWKTDLGTFAGGRFTPVSEDIVVPDGYVEAVSTIARNRINYCRQVLSSHFFEYAVGDPNADISEEN
ncbi:MAG: LTA synthase family protein [Saccharofermentans sp.]|nr:LTA synthase family protein [Saccharofermentans sp.]